MPIRRSVLGVTLLLGLGLSSAALAAECGTKRYCREMANCAEAAHYLLQCGLTRLDGDGDGIPCEALCGDNEATFHNRFGAQTRQSLLPATPECGAKRTCAEMVDCAEAMFHLKRCGVGSLDRDGDGIPCEGLCR